MTPARRRLDGDRIASHLCRSGPEGWTTLCGRTFARGTTRDAAGVPLCWACGEAWRAIADVAMRVSEGERMVSRPRREP